MNNIGLFGHNLAYATHKIQNAKTPQEATFRTALLSNEHAAETVDKVEFVQSMLTELDGSRSLDLNDVEGEVIVNAQTANLGKFRRFLGAANSPLKAITTRAPEGAGKPRVLGYQSEETGEMGLFVTRESGQATRFGLTKGVDGSKTYTYTHQSSDMSDFVQERVTMAPNGTLLMG